MKKRLSALAVVLLIFLQMPYAVAASREVLSEGDYVYRQLGDGTAEIVNYWGSDQELYIPGVLGGRVVSAIGDQAFSGRKKLAGVFIPDSVSVIGKYAFEECVSLISVSIPNSVTTIGDEAFNLCSSLASVSIPGSVTFIGDSAFSGCDSLTLTVPYGSYAERYCLEYRLNYTCPDAPDTPESSRQAGWSDEGDFEYALLSDGTAEISRYNGSDEEVFIPCALDGYPVTSIGFSAFEDCHSLVSVSIPDSVTSIEPWAFAWCECLCGITIPEGVTSIGDYAFYSCSSLNDISIPNSAVNIGEDVFSGCGSLMEIAVPPEHPVFAVIGHALINKPERKFVCLPAGLPITEYGIPDGIVSIANSAFSGCANLTRVAIPDSVTAIGDEAFENCENLTEISIPHGVTAIGDWTFSWCSSLTDITIPDSVTSIGNYAFSGCSSLTCISIPGSVTEIGYGVFESCFMLSDIAVSPDQSIFSVINGGLINNAERTFICLPSGLSANEYSIPDGIVSIANSAFSGCSGLTAIAIPGTVTNIGYFAFYGCDGLTNIDIPGGVTYIGDYAFAECYNLTGVSIPYGVTEITYGLFYWCENLTGVNIPDSVVSIGDWAFENCSGLASLCIPGSVTAIGENAFWNCGSLTLIVSPGSYAEQFCLDGGLPCSYPDEQVIEAAVETGQAQINDQLLLHSADLALGEGLDVWQKKEQNGGKVTLESMADGHNCIHLTNAGAPHDAWGAYVHSPLVELGTSWQGKEVTFSVWVKSDDWAKADEGISIALWLSRGDRQRRNWSDKLDVVAPGEVKWGLDAGYGEPLENNKWQRVWVTFKLDASMTAAAEGDNADWQSNTHMFVGIFLRRNGSFSFHSPKLEWGAAPTEWVLAAEDSISDQRGAPQLLRDAGSLSQGSSSDDWRYFNGAELYPFGDINLAWLSSSSATEDTWIHVDSPLVPLGKNWIGREVTFSVWLYSSNWQDVDMGVSIPLCLTRGDVEHHVWSDRLNIVTPGAVQWGEDAHYDESLENDTWKRVWVTFKLEKEYFEQDIERPFESNTHMYVGIFLRRNGDVYVGVPKLEWGSYATY